MHVLERDYLVVDHAINLDSYDNLLRSLNEAGQASDLVHVSLQGCRMARVGGLALC
jgi:hypothetical protein